MTTDVGQLRELTLEDGTRVTLNTDTRIEIRYDKGRRHIDLSQGEAWFDVAKEAARPFSVAAAGRQVLALGTSFVVRRDPDHLAVTWSIPRYIIVGKDGRIFDNDAPRPSEDRTPVRIREALKAS